MVKKIISAVAASSLLLAFPATVFAQDLKPVEVKPIPFPIWKTFEATPGNPVHLKGCGVLQAKGKGFLRYKDVRGRITLAGKGMLGVERSDVSKVKVRGFRRVTQIGRWVIFIGSGSANAWGTDLDLFFHGKGKTYARGCGKVSFWGKWVGKYIRLFRVKPVPLPIDLQFLKPIAN